MSRRLALIEAQRAALAYAQSDPEQRIRALEAENARLRRELADRSAQPEPLAAHNAARRAQSDRVREAIAEVVAFHEGPRDPTRKEILRKLDGMNLGCALPSLSAIGWHLRAIHKEASVNAEC